MEACLQASSRFARYRQAGPVLPRTPSRCDLYLEGRLSASTEASEGIETRAVRRGM